MPVYLLFQTLEAGCLPADVSRRSLAKAEALAKEGACALLFSQPLETEGLSVLPT